jgi:hypothetical protein
MAYYVMKMVFHGGSSSRLAVRRISSIKRAGKSLSSVSRGHKSLGRGVSQDLRGRMIAAVKGGSASCPLPHIVVVAAAVGPHGNIRLAFVAGFAR